MPRGGACHRSGYALSTVFRDATPLLAASSARSSTPLLAAPRLGRAIFGAMSRIRPTAFTASRATGRSGADGARVPPAEVMENLR
jgi:hypothetical protein